MPYQTTIEMHPGSIWGLYLPVSSDWTEGLIEGNNRRVLCSINGNEKFQTPLLPDGEGGYMITLNQQQCKKLGIKLGDSVSIEMEKDDSKYGLPVPPEFEELLLQDEDGSSLFHALTPGKQRNLLYIIGKPKSADLRLHKAIVILNYLKSTGGRLDFKELNEALKVNR
ncbi:DUF1905 domain-containing protein [bacterium SCSIO 12741]|nr:DUF1905 domain-containing protein [bacterium SCSIO 12741]